MIYVKPKKYLGQHFLKDEDIAKQIVDSLSLSNAYSKVLEVGAGTGVLTKYLIQNKNYETSIIDIDRESIEHLRQKFPQLEHRIIEGDFLKLNFENIFSSHHPSFALIGNFPYNISSQILFKVLEHKNQIPEVVGMFQKEVGERISSSPKNKSYGILSVLTQAFYTVEYLFTVNENVFNPPPKVKSAVLHFTRNNIAQLACDEKLFFQVVKTAFNQRRKTLRNSLKKYFMDKNSQDIPFLHQRAEELSWQEFEKLTSLIETLPSKI